MEALKTVSAAETPPVVKRGGKGGGSKKRGRLTTH
jgi:hypothetical protein